MSKLLIANRGEIAIRIARAADALGIPTVAVFASDDAESLHVRRAGSARPLGGEGAAAYLDLARMVAVARETGCTAVHPGYGFLSENAVFARACARNGLTFVGPSPEVLELFGDKTAARIFARERGVPVIPGTDKATSLAEVQAFAAEHGAVMIKALAGGGGRGMREVVDPAGIADAFAVCAREAEQSFGNGDLFVEKRVRHARHIEVQVVGDGSGRVVDLGERDCTVQLHHQKLLEMAPSPALTAARRRELLEAARKLAAHVKYAGLGTFEFLVTDPEFWFIEANPRLQVEHTVTEEVTGVDLVRAQIRIALGASLAEVGLEEPPPVRGFALQARVNLQTIAADGSVRPAAGTLTTFAPPSGPGVRVDTYGYRGYRTSLRYDSLLAKIIVKDADFRATCAATDRALAELEIEGVATNVGLLLAILRHPAFADDARVDTSFVDEHAKELAPAAAPKAAGASPATGDAALPPGGFALVAPMQAMVARVLVREGDAVNAGAALVQLEAMKMEHVLRANRAGVVSRVLARAGEMVDEDTALLHLAPGDGRASDPAAGTRPDLATATSGASRGGDDWSPELRQVERRLAMAETLGGADKIARQHESGRLTVRERIKELVDPGSFGEIGRLAGFGEYGPDGELVHVTPTNFVAGTARIDQRRVMIGADDFTGRGGSGDAAIWEKQIHSEKLAGELRLPVVRLLDGASGGGSVKMVVTSGFTYVPINPGWDAVVDNLSVVPVVSACLGPTVGLGAARLVMSHFAIMVEGIGQVFTAGPPVVRAASGEDLTKEELGGAAVHRKNGVVERFVASEAEAFTLIRRFLSYLPSSVYSLPPIRTTDDPADRRDERLLSAIPRSSRETYALDPILDGIFDRGSILRYAEYGGGTVTAFARLGGYPVGVLAPDPQRGSTMSAEGAMAVTRFVDLCETFHLPFVSLTDMGGVSIGLHAEKRGTLRYGARAIAAVYQARVPQAEIILRRVYGVGGAGMINRHRPTRSWAWPSGDWGSLPKKGGVEAAFRAQLAKLTDPAEHDAEVERLGKLLADLSSPFRTAEHFGVQDIIDPRDSRALLCEWVRDAYVLLPEQTGRPSFGARP